jgi:HEPN domain-containing protein
MRKETENWFRMSEYDLVTAEKMLETGRYVYVVFMCHLAIEKSIKAVITEQTSKLPPKSHDLIYLLGKAGIKLPPEKLDFVGKISNAGILTRYPEDLERLVESYPEEVVFEYLKQTREVTEWIKQNCN